MLITLYNQYPFLDPREYPQSLVVDFMVEKTWKNTKQEGVEVIKRTRRKRGYVYRVSLHRPTIYNFNTVCLGQTSSWHSLYDILLMEGEDTEDWILEFSGHGSKIHLPLRDFDPSLRPSVRKRMSFWDHLDDES